jgi:hypothetical protein
MLHLKLLEKQKQVKPRTSRRTEIIKIRAEVNEIETKQTNKKPIERIDETKSWFFERNKQD